MEISMYLAGVGGQGMQSAGKSLIELAAAAGYEVTYSPLYTFEKRGGLSSCYVVVSDKSIGSPRKEKHDILIAMNQNTYETNRDAVKPGGTLVVNTSQVPDYDKEQEGIHVVGVPFLELAAEAGDTKVISSIALGYLVEKCGLFPSSESVCEAALAKLKAKKAALYEMNVKAFHMGVEAAKQ